jgi:hypothetical protein
MRLPLIALTIALASPATAHAAYSGSETRSSGSVSATLTYSPSDAGIENELVITRAGAEAFRGTTGVADCGEQTSFCAPAAALQGPPAESLTVSDLDGDGEPEVIVDIYTGGAHCCTVSEVYRLSSEGYVSNSKYWGNSGYRLNDLGGDAAPEFLSQDDRFAYAFASYAYSAMPVRILRYKAGKWTVVTKRFRSQIKRDAATQWRYFRSANKTKTLGEPRGLAAAWAADQYMLGMRRSALKTLRKEARRGRLFGTPGTAAAFIKKLDHQLRRWGY